MAVWAFALGILQALSGALIVWSRLGLLSTLLHAGLMGLLFALLAYVVWQSLKRAQRNGSVPHVYLLSDATACGTQSAAAVTAPHGLAPSLSGVPLGSGRSPVADDADGQRPVGGSAHRPAAGQGE
jgi:heme A synthase